MKGVCGKKALDCVAPSRSSHAEAMNYIIAQAMSTPTCTGNVQYFNTNDFGCSEQGSPHVHKFDRKTTLLQDLVQKDLYAEPLPDDFGYPFPLKGPEKVYHKVEPPRAQVWPVKT